ncbi:MAG: hypothetical protein HY962_14140 [Ignavibacteriae bacterium]|nr:hypothetical protein [Ignavibacteriota bacterium]
MQRTTVVLLIAAVSVLAGPGCATLLHGRYQDVDIVTIPDSAEVLINGIRAGYSPVKVPLRRDGDFTVEFRRTGWRDTSIVLEGSVSTLLLVNVLYGYIGAPIGVGIDFLTGAAYELPSESTRVALQREAMAEPCALGGSQQMESGSQ